MEMFVEKVALAEVVEEAKVPTGPPNPMQFLSQNSKQFGAPDCEEEDEVEERKFPGPSRPTIR